MFSIFEIRIILFYSMFIFLISYCLKGNTMNALVNFIKYEDGLTADEYVIAASLMAAGLTFLFAEYGKLLQAALNRVLLKIT